MKKIITFITAALITAGTANAGTGLVKNTLKRPSKFASKETVIANRQLLNISGTKQAQDTKNMLINVALEGGFVTASTITDLGVKTGFGINASFIYFLPSAPKFGLVGSLGLSSFSGTTDISYGYGASTSIKTTISPFSISAGARYKFTEKLYGGLDLSSNSLSVKVEAAGASQTNSSSRLGFAPTVGYIIPAGPVNVDLAARFQYIATDGDAFHYIGIRAGIDIPLGK